jgi:hypothetical protein
MSIPFTPLWLRPTTSDPQIPGQLSNKRGTNTGADAFARSIKVANPNNPGERVSSIRVTATRQTAASGQAQAQLILDTGWVGAPVTNPLPTVSVAIPSGSFFIQQGWACTYGGRVYYASSSIYKVIMSAPLNGASHGSWRYENTNGLPNPTATTGPGTDQSSVWGIAAVAGRLWVQTDAAIWSSVIQADGTLAAWVKAASFGSLAGRSMTGGTDLSGNSFLFTAGGTSNATATWAIASDGTLTLISGGAATYSPFTPALVYDRYNARLYLIGGDNGGATVYTNTSVHTVSATGLLGAGAAGAPLPSARGRGGAALVVVGGTPQIYYAGGSVNPPFPGSGLTTVNFIPASNITGVGNAWSVGTATPVSMSAGGGWTAVFATDPHFTPNGYPYLVVMAGDQLNVYENPLAFGGGMGAWSNGAASALAAGSLGAGGAVVNNQDGTQTISWNWGGWGTGPYDSLRDGDIITEQVQVVGQTTGDPSPVSKIGQPPTISGVALSSTGRNPTLSWSYGAGAGGSAEKYWQVQVKSGSNVVADSGIQANTQNSYPIVVYPMTAWDNYTITVQSNDVPLPGSLASATSSATPTITATAPAVPTSVSVVADAVNGLFTLTWTNPTSTPQATLNRIYWRATGTSTWNILKDNIAASVNTPQSFSWMDQLRLGGAIDFAVSGISPSPSTESAMSAVVSATLTPDYHFETGGYQAVLSVAGDPTRKCRLFLTQPPRIRHSYDVALITTFADADPRARFGITDTRMISLGVSFRLAGGDTSDTLTTILNAAMNGSILLYRDTVGSMIYCVPTPEKTRDIDLYSAESLDLQEVQYAYPP